MSDEEEDARRGGEENDDSSSLPVFITKLLRMLQSNENTESVRWGNDGTTVLISDPSAFATVCPTLRYLNFGCTSGLSDPAAPAYNLLPRT
jgi:hypothetical protein